MGKQRKKQHIEHKKVDKYLRVCEQCGNELRTNVEKWKCPYCKWVNGLQKDRGVKNG